MAFMILKKTRTFLLHSAPDSIVQTTIAKLSKELEYNNVNISIDKNRIFFTGNFMSFVHGSLDCLDGEIEVCVSEENLELTYHLSFLGPAIFIGATLIIATLAYIQKSNIAFFFFPTIFMIIFLIGWHTFDNLITFIGSETVRSCNP